MMTQAPTRITIEVHHADPDAGAAPFVRVVPTASSAHTAAYSERREDPSGPAAFDPGECRCLDDDDCLADHAND